MATKSMGKKKPMATKTNSSPANDNNTKTNWPVIAGLLLTITLFILATLAAYYLASLIAG